MTDLIAYPTTSYNSWLDEDDTLEFFERRLHSDEWDAANYETQITALLQAFRTLDELELDITWNDDRTLSDSYTDDQKSDILEALQRSQCEQALHELKFDTDGPEVQSVGLGGLLNIKFPNSGKSVPRFSERAISILRPLIKARSVNRFR